jgi:hypothetical protein
VPKGSSARKRTTATTVRAYLDLSQRNLTKVELDLGYVPNKTNYSTNSTKLLYGNVGGAALKKLEQSGSTYALNTEYLGGSTRLI